jgi:hypothetical protein
MEQKDFDPLTFRTYIDYVYVHWIPEQLVIPLVQISHIANQFILVFQLVISNNNSKIKTKNNGALTNENEKKLEEPISIVPCRIITKSHASTKKTLEFLYKENCLKIFKSASRKKSF